MAYKNTVKAEDLKCRAGIASKKHNIRGWMTGINDVDALAQPNDPNDLFAFKINYTDVEVSGMNGVQPLYNGNISETFWRSYNDNVKRAYGYTYDDLNRMDEAFYQKPGLTAANINNYREKLTYDENGNILTLKRNGNLDNGIQEIEIDDLTYTYPQDSNQLLKVTDATLHPSGFEDDSTDGTLATDTTDDYAYDSMGNMTSDENKGIQEIKYNHLNLPTYIDLGGKGNISYIYDATGRKVRKLVQDDVLTQNKQVDYADGFQYENNILQFFPTAEGYASRLTTKIEQSGQLIKIPIEELPEDQFSYVYNYTDHLGNIRLSYSLDPDTQQLKIVEQNHYYPFGMRHTNYSGGRMVMVKDEELKRMAPATEEFLTYKYKYNGKEWQDELGLNLYDYGARNYDAALGRWMNIDPLAEKYRRWSPYNYCMNNPIYFIDPDGMQISDGIYIDKKGEKIGEDSNGISDGRVYVVDGSAKREVVRSTEQGKTIETSELNGKNVYELASNEDRQSQYEGIFKDSEGVNDREFAQVNIKVEGKEDPEIIKNEGDVVNQGDTEATVEPRYGPRLREIIKKYNTNAYVTSIVHTHNVDFVKINGDSSMNGEGTPSYPNDIQKAKDNPDIKYSVINRRQNEVHVLNSYGNYITISTDVYFKKY
ncbi:RHS repeat domain-containing protein [Flavobacterium sp. N1719]|uniref:RHS repeat domain-containing protein n=1 Tax=Flavobacterium sp. N1719 TaxID=2885633 RepID=UPI00222221F4|nr:RHS repeat-associated core domain-containing protein [Flavobacterium sp. N1719]